METRSKELLAEFTTDLDGRVALHKYDSKTFTVSHWIDSIEGEANEVAVFEMLDQAHNCFVEYVRLHLAIQQDLESQDESSKENS